MTQAWLNLLTPMPPHGNLTNMGLTEPGIERKKQRIRKSNRELEKEKSERLPGEAVTCRHTLMHDPLKLSI